MTNIEQLEESAHESILSTEKNYREQIFSTGCSSTVPIYRIVAKNIKPDALIQHLQGSPYIQNGVTFSEKIIETLIDVSLYVYDEKHFFFQGDIPNEIQEFLDKHCQKLESIAPIVQPEVWDKRPTWCNFTEDCSELVKQFPILQQLNLNELSEQLFSATNDLQVPFIAQAHLEMLQGEDLRDKLDMNQSSLYFMVEIANQLSLDEFQIQNLILIGMLKDLGYTRMQDQMDNFEIMHPLVSHQLLFEANQQASFSEKIPERVLSAILVQHEFSDGSGPLNRMKHPQVTKIIDNGMPLEAQISSLCDLYFSLLKDYSPTLAFAIASGFVLGQGNVEPRYEPDVIHSFSKIFNSGDFKNIDVPEKEAEAMLLNVLGALKDKNIRTKAIKMVASKSDSWYERITLALNIVRNIAAHQPIFLSEQSLVNVLKLPEEFGLEY